MIGTLETGYGWWNAIIWTLTITVLLLLVYWIRSFGEKRYKERTEQVKPFLAGIKEPPKEAIHLRGSNVYWGFTEALGKYYGVMTHGHTGIVNDYIYWFVIVLACVLILVVGVF